MNPFPVTPLVRQVQSLIIKTFIVSEQDALDYAAEFVALAEGWGSPEDAKELNWSYRIKKDLGETNLHQWRSEKEREKFLSGENQKYADWDAFIKSRKRG